MVETNFKQTEIGIIPSDWDVKSLGCVAKIFDGTHQTPRYVQAGGHPFYSVENVTANDFINTKYIGDSEYKFLTQKVIIEEGDILMTRIGSIGICKYIDWTAEAAFYVSLALLKPFAINGRYLSYASESQYFIEDIKQNSLLFAIPQKINLGKIQNVRIAIPASDSEQLRIAEVLSDMDKLIAALEKKITKKLAIKQGAMQQLLTGKKRLPGFTDDWLKITLGDIATLKNGYAFKSNSYSSCGQYKIITIANVQNGYLDKSSFSSILVVPEDLPPHCILAEGDMLISMTGNVGRVCKVDIPFCLQNQRVGKLTFKPTIDKDFIYSVLNTPFFENEMIDKGHGAAQPNIGKSDIESYSFKIPPTQTEQMAIAAILLSMNEEIEQLQQKLMKYKSLKQGMMQKLLTGQIRLI